MASFYITELPNDTEQHLCLQLPISWPAALSLLVCISMASYNATLLVPYSENNLHILHQQPPTPSPSPSLSATTSAGRYEENLAAKDCPAV